MTADRRTLLSQLAGLFPDLPAYAYAPGHDDLVDVPDDFGMFIMGPMEDLVIPFGNGALCIGGTLDRLLPVTLSVGNANQRALDFTSGGPESQIGAGDTWYFQFWCRDQGQGSESNLSNGLKATFVN